MHASTRQQSPAQDSDPLETTEWRDAFVALAAAQGPERARFLLDELYRHPKVKETSDRAKQVVWDLFLAYMNDPGQMQGGVKL